MLQEIRQKAIDKGQHLEYIQERKDIKIKLTNTKSERIETALEKEYSAKDKITTKWKANQRRQTMQVFGKVLTSENSSLKDGLSTLKIIIRMTFPI